MLRQSLLGLIGVESGKGDPTPQEVEEIRALAVINVTDCVVVLDLYLTGSVLRRDQKPDLEASHNLVHNGIEWRVGLSDDASTLAITKEEPFVSLDLSKQHTEKARVRWRRIDVEETRAPISMEDPEAWKRALVNDLMKPKEQADG